MKNSENPEDEIVPCIKWIRLKRFERPPEGYFEDFVGEFQRRQRAELLSRSAHGIFFERVATYFSGFSGVAGIGKHPWLVGTGAAAVVTLSIAFMLSAEDHQGQRQSQAATAPRAATPGENVLWDVVHPAPSTNRLLPVYDPPRMGPVELIPVTHQVPRDF